MASPLYKGGAAHVGPLSADIVGPGPGAAEYCPEGAQGLHLLGETWDLVTTYNWA